VYNRAVVYPYNLGSASARSLAQALQTRRVRPNGNYHHRRNTLVINWGNSRLPGWGSAQALANMLNKPQNVEIASDKIATFRRLETNIPEWTTDRQVARDWFANPRFGRKLNAVVCRTLTRANSGRGIVLAKSPEELVNAPLYTRYTPKEREFRVHMSARYGIIDSAEKRRRNGFEHEADHDYIRSWNNGWVFCRENLQLPDGVERVAAEALAHLGLDFGAVDVGWSGRYGTYIYEVNTAPGLEGQTLTNYTNMFRRHLGNQLQA